MSTRILILKDGVIKPASSSDDLGIGGSSLALGTTSNTAYRGDYGHIAYLHSQITSGNPHGITKGLIGLGNVDDTSDLNKPVSTATQTALNLKANLASPAFTGTVTGITASMVGLGNLTNLAQVDLSSNQTIGGIKTFTNAFVLSSTSGTTIGTFWRNGDNLEYKDSANVTKIILNSAGNLSNLANKQASLNNLVGTQTANRVLRSDGTNVTLSQITLTTDVTGILPVANGGTGSSTQNFVDLTTTQTIQGAKTFSGSPIIITASTTGTGGTGSVLKVTQTGSWSANSPYALEVVGFTFLDGFRITGQGGARGIYQIGSTLQLDFATNNGDITFTSGATGTVERLRLKNSDGGAVFTSTTVSTSTTTGGAIFAGGVGIAGRLSVNSIVCISLPTSTTGLPSGALWRNGNVINIV